MKKYRLIFLGTPIFASEVLTSLINLSAIDVVGVITQPDRVVGRKKELIYSPVKQVALANNIPIFQPNKIIEIHDQLVQLEPDILLTCAYGQIIPEKILQVAKINTLNIHASLLPQLRGGAPIHKAIMYGLSETGISIMKMVKKMDAGEVYLQKKVKIEFQDTASSLHDKLVNISKEIMNNDLVNIIEGKYPGIAQDESKVTFAYNISREEERIDWSKSKLDIYNHIRGLYAWPIAYSEINDTIFKIHKAQITDEELSVEDTDKKNGTIVNITKQGIKVKVKDGYILLTKIQKAGKNPVDAIQFYNNHTPEIKITNQLT